MTRKFLMNAALLLGLVSFLSIGTLEMTSLIGVHHHYGSTQSHGVNG